MILQINEFFYSSIDSTTYEEVDEEPKIPSETDEIPLNVEQAENMFRILLKNFSFGSLKRRVAQYGCLKNSNLISPVSRAIPRKLNYSAFDWFADPFFHNYC